MKKRERFGLLVILVVMLALILSGCDLLDWLFPKKNAYPTASFTFSPAKPYVGNTVIFDGSASNDPDGQIVSYTWSFGDGSSGSGVTTTHVYTKAGTYKVSLEVTDNKGAKGSTSKTIAVAEKPSQNEKPSASFTFTVQNPQQEGKISIGDKIVFDASSSSDPDGEIVLYRWELEPGSIRTGEKVTYVYRKAGSYSVTLTVEDDLGATDSETQIIEVVPVPPKPPVAIFTFSPQEPKPGDPVSFDASGSYDPDGGEIALYEWDFGDGTTGSGVTVIHKFNQAGRYLVTLTVTDDDEPPQKGEQKGEILILSGELEIVAQFPSPGQEPRGLAWDGRYLWCADAGGEGALYKIDPSNGNVVAMISPPGMEPAGLAWDGKYLWNIDRIEGKIFQLESRTGQVMNDPGIDVPGPGPTSGLTWDGSYLWVADDETFQLYRVDPKTGRIVSSIPSPGEFPRGLAWDGSRLWNVDMLEGLYRIDPKTGATTAFFEPPFGIVAKVEGMTWGGSYLWIVDSEADKIYKIKL